MYCGNYATADGNAINKLMTPFNRTIWSEMKTTGPGKCERHACMDTSAIYVCNVSRAAPCLNSRSVLTL